MKLGLHLNVGLRQTLAPQLIQSLKMLQMPVLKLEQTIRHELATNPLLEELEDLEPENPDETEDEENSKEEIDWEDYLFDDDDGYKVKEMRETTEERFESTATQSKNLYQHLTEQLSFLKLSEEEHLIGEYIIGNIGPEGYICISAGEMAEELTIDVELIEEVLKLIQRFDPLGVGSRDLRESLLIQLKDKGFEHALAYRIVDGHINNLDKKSILQIARFMSVPLEKAQAAMDVIKNLAPTPTYGRFEPAAMPVVPDLTVERFGEEYIIVHNDSYVPRLRINNNYKNLIKRGNSSSGDTRKYVKQKLEQARWLLNSINQRRSTMIKVMAAIVERQKEFFENGPAFIKPMIMEDIATEVDMNVATISRVANSKYVQTPFGVKEIKYFFNSGIAKEDGEDMSKLSVKVKITDLIKNEPPEKPYSDQEIFRRLNEEGIKLARRTVTKYREEMKIQPARLRKHIT